MLNSMKEVKKKNDERDIIFYGLSTCGWCRKCRIFLDDHDLSYRFIYLDTLEGDERDEAVEEVKKINSKLSFPTVVVDGEVIVGFNEDKYKEVFE